jgi:molybdopterin-guanine dinucleotide biosynthesis protein A
MGGADKALVAHEGRPLLAHVIERFRPQVDELVISANGDPARFAAFGLEVVPDPIPDHPGPLAGIAAAALWARRRRPDLTRVASVPVDNPFLPGDLVARLAAALAADPLAGCAVAASGGRVHPVAALHPVDAVDDLLPGLASGEIRRLMTWVERCRGRIVDFTLADEDPFTNFNTLEDIAAHALRGDRRDPPKVSRQERQ